MISQDNSIEIAKHIAILFGAYGQGNDIDRQSIYVADLADFSAELIGLATQKLRYESTFLPSISEIVKACKSLVATNHNKSLPAWDEAQREITRELQNAGIYKKPSFSRPEIAQVVHTYGWLNICMANADNMGTVWAQLRKLYETISQRKNDVQVNKYVLKDKPQGYLGYQEVSNGGLLPFGEVMQISANNAIEKG